MWRCQVGGRVGKGSEGNRHGIEGSREDSTGKAGVGGGGGKKEEEAAVSNGGGSGNSGGCGFFEWAEFTDDGEPVWKHRSNNHLKKTSMDNGDAVLEAEQDEGTVSGRV